MTSQNIKNYLQKNRQATGFELSRLLNLTDRAIRKQLSNLLAKGEIVKIGKAPKVYYSLPDSNIPEAKYTKLDSETTNFITENYLYISPSGERLFGIKGFEVWCQKIKAPIPKTANDYVNTLNKYYKLRRNGLINGQQKLINTFKEIGLDKLFYLDFYSIDRFGKTKLGQMLLYAKQSQNRSLIKELIESIKAEIKKVVIRYKITSIGYIPPTVKREVQLMKELELGLNLNLRRINLVKIKTEISIPQKTLTKLEDRIENAKKTIIVDDKQIHQNILLIDDAVGSGSTLNETALQIRDKGICKGKIIGLAITGSYKGFDVISEV